MSYNPQTPEGSAPTSGVRGSPLLAVPGSENDAVELEHAGADAPAESGSDTTVGAPTWGSTYDRRGRR